MFSSAAKTKGYKVFAAAVKGETKPGLKTIVDDMLWVEVGQFKKMVKFFKSKGINRAVMAGQISPRRLFDKRINWDEELRHLLANISNKKADTIFSAIADLLSRQSIELIDSTSFLNEKDLPQKGVLTARNPSREESDDINFGLDIAKRIAGLDIGQSVVIKDKCIIAVEAFEGTNATIRRAARLVGKGTVVVKVSRPNQDMRFDVPVIGPETIKLMKAVGATAIGIEAGRTVVIESEKAVNLANRFNIAITAV